MASPLPSDPRAPGAAPDPTVDRPRSSLSRDTTPTVTHEGALAQKQEGLR